jgi:hypothetical protein
VSGFFFLRQEAQVAPSTKEMQMATQPVVDQIGTEQPLKNKLPEPGKKRPILTPDGWAVAVALLLAALVRLGVLKHVAW